MYLQPSQPAQQIRIQQKHATTEQEKDPNIRFKRRIYEKGPKQLTVAFIPNKPH